MFVPRHSFLGKSEKQSSTQTLSFHRWNVCSLHGTMENWLEVISQAAHAHSTLLRLPGYKGQCNSVAVHLAILSQQLKWNTLSSDSKKGRALARLFRDTVSVGEARDRWQWPWLLTGSLPNWHASSWSYSSNEASREAAISCLMSNQETSLEKAGQGSSTGQCRRQNAWPELLSTAGKTSACLLVKFLSNSA
jgi:hypothetical protein